MNRLPKRRANQAGFTLTELLVVLVILSLIAAAITPQVMGRLDRSKVRAAELQLDTLGTSLDMFKIDRGRYPTTEEGLAALLAPPGDVADWSGPYVKSSRSIIDPWSKGFVYQAQGSTYTLMTLGADGEIGGEGQDADLVFPDYTFPSAEEN